ncbi:TGF-beta receptor type-1-like [Uloborus diversus]|uniref:TGF-beta receptor type-1-like n=1 Tax=Uloborus diversus TaxID=327109 RepID=UPI002408FE09|nr:TGF-beta receptor type-1-like [Uloborus diversus]
MGAQYGSPLVTSGSQVSYKNPNMIVPKMDYGKNTQAPADYYFTGNLICYCDDDLCKPHNNTCITDGICYVSAQLNDWKEPFYMYRCLNKSKYFPYDVEEPFMCRENPKKRFERTYCCDEDYCTKGIKPKIPMGDGDAWDRTQDHNETTLPRLHQPPLDFQTDEPQSVMQFWRSEVFLAVIVPLAIIFLMVLCLICLRGKHKKERQKRYRKDVEAHPTFLEPALDGMSIQELIETTTSGSGSGPPVAVQLTIARKIRLLTAIGQGRFGQVYKGSFNAEFVAVKIFSSRDEKSWSNEVEIYQTAMVRHENILGFIAADNKDSGTWLQLWLVTELHENGSLFDYLSKNTVDCVTMCNMARSITSGLTHLHMEILGTRGKPAIAHRDIKSKNILVNKYLNCVVADLGLAVRYDSENDKISLPENQRVGTKRYLAPEMLDGTYNASQFESYKRADIYALGLVFWEIASRCHVGGKCPEYNLPYHDMVPSDPTIEEMKKVVCTDKKRPPCPNTWQSFEILRVMSKLMRECWYQNAAARLTALRVKKTIAALQAQESIKN